MKIYKQLFLTTLISCFIYYCINSYLFTVSNYYNKFSLNYGEEAKYINRIVLTSECSCRKDKVILEEYKNFYQVKVVEYNETLVRRSFKLDKETVIRSNCGLYNVLRRGIGQKIIGYSLYGTQRRYYNLIYDNVELAVKRYPGWVIRVHYNDSILKNITCKVECHKNKNNNFYDNIDFCNINKIPRSIINTNDTWDAAYTHAMKWRWYDFLSN